MQLIKSVFIALIATGSVMVAGAANATDQLDELTSPQVRARIAAGATTIIIPVGGTEQNGPFMALGKHNARARYFARAIAHGLGNALVAPVVAYVPEGAIHPPAAHMRFAGTISIPDAAFEALLEGAARSFKQHGFRDVVLIGDHGGYQQNLQHVADRLTKQWAGDKSCRVHAFVDYYRASQAPLNDALKKQGFSEADIGTHAGLADTALTLATVPDQVRAQGLAQAPKPGAADGVQGDPRRASAALAAAAAANIIQTSVSAIAQLTRAPR
jgi:creatinine amidohydrolase/Fe(II)-dependent formamide hydrolase-like protein